MRHKLVVVTLILLSQAGGGFREVQSGRRHVAEWFGVFARRHGSRSLANAPLLVTAGLSRELCLPRRALLGLLTTRRESLMYVAMMGIVFGRLCSTYIAILPTSYKTNRAAYLREKSHPYYRAFILATQRALPCESQQFAASNYSCAKLLIGIRNTHRISGLQAVFPPEFEG